MNRNRATYKKLIRPNKKYPSASTNGRQPQAHLSQSNDAGTLPVPTEQGGGVDTATGAMATEKLNSRANHHVGTGETARNASFRAAVDDVAGATVQGTTELSVADIEVGPGFRHHDEAAVNAMSQSIDANGLLSPILVSISQRQPTPKYTLVFGRLRMLAVTSLGRDTILASVIEDAEAAVALKRIAENLDRVDLTVLQRAESLVEKAALLGLAQKDVQLAHPGGHQPHDKGISRHAILLGTDRDTYRRAFLIANIVPEAKERAVALDLDSNQSALLAIAGVAPELQAEKAETIAALKKHKGKGPSLGNPASSILIPEKKPASPATAPADDCHPAAALELPSIEPASAAVLDEINADALGIQKVVNAEAAVAPAAALAACASHDYQLPQELNRQDPDRAFQRLAEQWSSIPFHDLFLDSPRAAQLRFLVEVVLPAVGGLEALKLFLADRSAQ